MNDYIKKIQKKILKDFESACVKMDEKKLTEEERFAVAVMAGVPWEFKVKDGTTPTTALCGIAVANNKWIVSYKEPEGGVR